MNINNFSEQVGELLGKNDLKGCIFLLSNLLKSSPKLDEVVMQSARFNDISSQIRMGVVDFEQANIVKNKIRYAILDLVRDIEETIETDSSIKKEVEALQETEKNAQIVLNHSGSGDNVIGGKIVVRGTISNSNF